MLRLTGHGNYVIMMKSFSEAWNCQRSFTWTSSSLHELLPIWDVWKYLTGSQWHLIKRGKCLKPMVLDFTLHNFSNSSDTHVLLWNSLELSTRSEFRDIRENQNQGFVSDKLLTIYFPMGKKM